MELACYLLYIQCMTVMSILPMSSPLFGGRTGFGFGGSEGTEEDALGGRGGTFSEDSDFLSVPVRGRGTGRAGGYDSSRGRGTGGSGSSIRGRGTGRLGRCGSSSDGGSETLRIVSLFLTGMGGATAAVSGPGG